MAGKKSRFLEQIERARAATQGDLASAPEGATSKPAEQMSDAELEAAVRDARRRVLDLEHQELREREIARVSGAGEATEQPQASGLAEVLGSLQKQKRRTWR